MLDDQGAVLPRGQTGNLAVRLPLPPGCAPTLWQNAEGFRSSYLADFPGWYRTGDAGVIDADGDVSVMGRTDDVINVAGHRLSTGAMEGVLAAHPNVAECAVVGMADALKGQVPLGLVVLKAGVGRPEAEIAAELVALVRERIGPVAAFRDARVVKRLPKTRSGKILRNAIRRLADGEAGPVPATIEDPAALDEIAAALRRRVSLRGGAIPPNPLPQGEGTFGALLPLPLRDGAGGGVARPARRSPSDGAGGQARGCIACVAATMAGTGDELMIEGALSLALFEDGGDPRECRLSLAVTVYERPEGHEVDADAAQQPHEAALHDGAPVGQAKSEAEVQHAFHEGQEQQRVEAWVAAGAPVLGEHETGNLAGGTKRYGGEVLGVADVLDGQAEGAVRGGRHQTRGADQLAILKAADQKVVRPGIELIDFELVLAWKFVVASFKHIDLIPEPVGLPDQGWGIGEFDTIGRAKRREQSGSRHLSSPLVCPLTKNRSRLP